MYTDLPALTNVRAEVLTAHSIEVKWNKSTYTAADYLISYKNTTNYRSSSVTVNDGSTTTHTLINLEQNTKYIITVQATTSDNRLSEKSNEVSKTTLANGKRCTISQNVMLCMYNFTVPHLPPQNIMVTSTDPASLKAHWELPSNIDEKGPITGHVIQCTRVGSDDVAINNVGRETTHTVSGLVPYTKYSVSVAAKNANGTGPFSIPEQQFSGEHSEFTTQKLQTL